MERAKRMAGSAPGKPLGNITRGTTAPNRLRRVDRWLTGTQTWRLRQAAAEGSRPLIVDLGFGANPTTAVELYQRLSAAQPGIELVGIEIDPVRVAQARQILASGDEHPGLSFRQGGFEIPTEHEPTIVRAFNVLQQYEAVDVPGIWALVTSRLAPGGLFVDGTCDEIGRHASWIALSSEGPETLSLSLRLGSFNRPSEIAERLPKALIHRNVPGDPVHRLLQDLDRHWVSRPGLAVFGSQQRWIAACEALKADGWPVLDRPARWRLGELTIAWAAVDHQGP